MKKNLKKLLSVLLVLTTLVTMLATMTTAYASRTVNYKNTIFLGDSRTVGMYNTFNGTSLKEVDAQDSNGIWYAKNATAYSWFKKTAAPAVDKKVKSGYNVVILMGINDCKGGATANLTSYINYINKLAYKWAQKGAHTYFVSLNPVGTTGSGKNGTYTKDNYTITNKKQVVSWNKQFKESLSSDVTYIDTYSDIIDDFETKDSLHYTNTTNKEIYKLVTNAIKNDSDMTLSRSGLSYTTKKGWSKVSYTGFIDGTDAGLGGWVYVEDGTAQTSYTGLASGCAKGVTGKFYVKKGIINYSFTGKAKDDDGTWYVKKGQVQTSYSGKVTISGKTYTVKNGKIS